MIKVNPSEKDKYQAEFHLYLDERDNRSVADVFFTPNGFTEPTVVEDFPVRDRKFVLHIRRRRWNDEQGRNIILSTYPLVAEGPRISPEFAAFLKIEWIQPRDCEVRKNGSRAKPCV